jgi:hypothetical protein
MEPPAKPTNRSGGKNIFCPYYHSCLDYAAKRNWNSWHCSNCDYKSTKKPIRLSEFIADNALPYYSLSPELSKYLYKYRKN